MSHGLIERLAKAIGYPQEVPAGTGTFDFIVDGERISVAEVPLKSPSEGELIFQVELTGESDEIVRLAGYAAGRLMKEEATLAWEPEKRAAILWQRSRLKTDVEGNGELTRSFERFVESADWWRERIRESVGLAAGDRGTMTIRP